MNKKTITHLKANKIKVPVIILVLVILLSLMMIASNHYSRYLPQTTPGSTQSTPSIEFVITPTNQIKPEPDVSGGIILTGVLLLSVIILGTLSATLRIHARRRPR